MARPKSVFLEELADSAQADLEVINDSKIGLKLRAIIAATKHPIRTVSDVFGVAAETIWRWGTAYRKDGLGGLNQKPRRPKPSKLTSTQKAEILSWLDTGKTAQGENIHWTLERLRYAISEAFGVTLGINTIWVWLRKENLKLKVPRPRHYKADKQAQEAFKKTLYSGER